MEEEGGTALMSKTHFKYYVIIHIFSMIGPILEAVYRGYIVCLTMASILGSK
jgi:hypothetical protein